MTWITRSLEEHEYYCNVTIGENWKWEQIDNDDYLKSYMMTMRLEYLNKTDLK